MRKIHLILPAISFAACTAQGGTADKLPPVKPAGESPRPNIVFILADDMGIGDVGCYGQKIIRTPNIDGLAASGLKFSHHYSGSTVSAPSRCALVTGKDTGHGYVRGNLRVNGGDNPLPEGETTVAHILKSKGYATGCVGKWGLGGPGTSGAPGKMGFDYFFGYLDQAKAHRYYPDYLYENEKQVWLNGEVYSHFLIMDRGLDFIRANADRPFFAYFAITPPHADLDYPDISAYEDLQEPPGKDPSSSGSFKYTPKPHATYASMVAEIDKNVGAILDLLKQKGILENTIVIFSSDNGVHKVGGHEPDFFDSNGPFRGYKRDLYEGGVRAPFIVSWKNTIAPGQQTGHISAFWDFLPTVCDLVGATAPADINGISYAPTLLGKGKQGVHDHIYFEFYEAGGRQSILVNGWKFIRLNISNPKQYKEELYYLPDDTGEENNLITTYPAKAAELNELAQKSRTPSALYNW